MSKSPTLGWSDSKESQSLMVKVTSWGHQLWFSEGGKRPDKRHFSWDGVVAEPNEGLAGTEVLGDFEIRSTFSRINIEEIHKEKDTSGTCGFLFLSPPNLGIDLYVTEETYHELHRIFSSAIACGERGGAWVEITVTHTQSNLPGFWQEGWHGKHLEISNWRVMAGASFKKSEDVD